MREWLVGLVGENWAPTVQLVLTVALVVILIFVVIWVARNALGGSGLRTKGRGPRLAVMDVAPIDQKRKLVLVRRDEVEHLLLIGGQNDIVVEASILRISQASRVRTEPTMRPEPGAATFERPPERGVERAIDRVRPIPQAAAVPAPQRPAAPPVTSRTDAGEPRAASPLTRPIPRQIPVPPAARTTAAVFEESASAGDVDLVAPPVAPPIQAPIAPPAAAMSKAPVIDPPKPAATAPTLAPDDTRQEPDVSATRATAIVTPPVLPMQSVEASKPASVDEAVPAAATPPVKPFFPPVVAPRPAPPVRAEKPAQADTPIQSRVEPEMRQTATVVPPRGPAQQAVQNMQAKLPAGDAPAPRQAPLVAPPTARSMATPTYPQRPSQNPADDLPMAPAESRDASPIGDDTGHEEAPPKETPPAPQAPLVTPFADILRSSAVQPARPTAAPFGTLPVRAAGPVSPMIAAAERQSEALKRSQDPVPEAAEPSASTGDPGEKRPLSVKSFATTIQSMKPSYEPPIVTAKPAAPALEPTSASEPVVSTAKPFVPLVAPVVVAETAARMPPMAAPIVEAPTPPSGDSGTELEDFLSAELDSDFGNVRWDDEPSSSPSASKAPAVIIDAPEPQNAPVSADPVSAAPAPAPKPKGLSLEEEMERLLGDFDFVTSDRKSN